MYYFKNSSFCFCSLAAPYSLLSSMSTATAALAGMLLEFRFLFSLNLFALVIDTKSASPERVGDF